MPTLPGAPSSGPARFAGFQDLAQHRVENILLVSSLYDSFILAEDGQLGERILGEFLDLSFRHSPGITRVSSGAEALALAARERRYNLVVTSLHVGDMDALQLARGLKQAGLDVPVVLLAYDGRELGDFLARHDSSDLAGVFLWQGDVTVLLAIVKCIEDRENVAHDVALMGVQVVLVIEAAGSCARCRDDSGRARVRDRPGLRRGRRGSVRDRDSLHPARVRGRGGDDRSALRASGESDRRERAVGTGAHRSSRPPAQVR
jgi:CheY-like chemotaxis protein